MDFRGDLFRPHHRGAQFRQLRLLAGLRIELGQFRDRGAQIIGLARRRLDLGAVPGKVLLAAAPVAPRLAGRAGSAEMTAETIEQFAMRARIDQRALVVLAVDLDQRVADVAHQRDAGRLVVDEDARAAIRRLHAAQDDVAVVLDGVFGQQRADRMVARHVEHGDDLALCRAVAHQRSVAAGAKRQRQRVEQDGFSGAGFAGQHGKAGQEVDVQLLDQDDIADRQSGKHQDPDPDALSFKSNCCAALSLCLSIGFSQNRFPPLGPMLRRR